MESFHHFTPAEPVVSANRLYTVFIDLWVGIADSTDGEMLFQSNADLVLVTGMYQRIRYNGRKK